MANKVPPALAPSSPMNIDPYERNSFWGRMIYFHALIDPRHMFRSNENIQKSERYVEMANNGEWDRLRKDGVTEKQLQKANVIVKSCVHPTSKEIIFPAGRLSGFVPLNIPLSAAMTLTKPYLPYIIGSQTCNQLYNAMFNYCNGASGGTKKSSSTKTTSFFKENEDLIKGCGAAVLVSVGLSVGLNQWVKKARFSPSIKFLFQTGTPYVAVASAGMANVACMRFTELKTGIPVYSEHGDLMGHSRIAAKQAIFQTAISRAVLPIPIVGLPGPIVSILFRLPFFASSATMKALTQLSVVTMMVWIGLPAAVAVFPQDAKIGIEDMEDDIRRFRDPIGRSVNYAVFNKGV